VCYGSRRMKGWLLVGLLAVLVAVSGCSSVRQILGIPSPGEPTINLKSAEARWLLIKNPRFGDVRSEPEYIWVEEDKTPTTIGTLVRGQSSIIAPPEVVARYGPPPGGGKISPRQGVPYQVSPSESRATGSAAPAAPPPAQRPAGPPADRPTGTAVAAVPPVPAPEPPKRGFVVYVDTTRIVVDLTGVDGIRVGQILSVRRDQIPVVHPVTNEVLGELDDEVATVRVVEVRERFSIGEIQSATPGAQVQPKDRVVPK
jgi:Flagellar assembly protein T, C-terminal domain